jgi:hypothetical protein
MSARDRKLFLLFAGIAFAYVALRAVLVPLTHDEARTFFVYTLSGEFLPWLSHWDAGNHLLCTALGWISFEAFGMAPWSLRLFSVLSFLLYAWYAWHWGARLNDRVVRWCLWTALLLAPVLIEFFSMYRGYGLAMAFLLMALHHTASAVRHGSGTHVLAALLGWLLAAVAMLSLMILWSAALVLLVAPILSWPMRTAKRALLGLGWLLLGGVPWWVASRYAGELKARGLLYYGSDEGLFHGTLRSLGDELFGLDAVWIAALMAAVGLAALGVAAWSFLRTKPRSFDPLSLLSVLLLTELVGRVVLGEGFQVLYPTGRTALHLLPLTVLIIAFAVQRLTALGTRWHWAALLLMALPVRTVRSANLTHTSLWPEEAISTNIFDRAARMQKAAGRPLLIDAYRQMPPQWDHERLLSYPTLAPLSPHGFPQPDCDLLLIDTTYFTAPPGFRTIATSATGRQVLKQRIAPLRMALLTDSTLAPKSLDNEYSTLFEPPVEQLLANELVLEFELVLRSDDRSLETLLVIEVDGPEGEHLHYDLLELKTLQRTWTGDTLHFMRRLPRLPGNARRVVAYLWNQRRQDLELTSGRVRLLRIQPDHDLRTL